MSYNPDFKNPSPHFLTNTKIVKQVLERSHLIVPRSGVNPIADCDIAYLLAREIYLGIISRLQVVTPKA